MAVYTGYNVPTLPAILRVMARGWTIIAAAAVVIGGCWSRDNPFDATRCDPACAAGQICFEGCCVIADAGVRDGPSLPDGPDAAQLVCGDRSDIFFSLSFSK